MKIAVIQGPNLNMLGIREQHIYGSMSLEQIHDQLKNAAAQNGIEVEFFQSNLEGEIVDRIQECLGTVDGIMINPAAYSHTSIAIKDALSAVSMPVVEVHAEQVLVVIREFDMDAELLRECQHIMAGRRLDLPRGLIELYRIHPITSCTFSACISGCLPWPASRPARASA